MRILKDPLAVLDFMVDWAGTDPGPWLAVNEEITDSEWVIPAGITGSNESNTETTATVWLSGGTLGASYNIRNKITTNQGRTDIRTYEIAVRNR